MSATSIPDGAWPTMITPYGEDGRIDYATLEALIEWYIARGVAGLFAVCQSSEMFFLSQRERIELATACVRIARGRLPVIASGHIADDPTDQVEEAKAMADTGVAAVVLISNRFAGRLESDDVWKRNLAGFLEAFTGPTTLGLYECPWPYKRVLSPEIAGFCAGTGRFGFLKDTCCRIEDIRSKLAAAKGTGFKLFNANAATLLESLQAGAAGYSGIMTNFHADLYAWICAHHRAKPALASELQDFLGMASVMEYQYYPVNSMYALTLEGLAFRLHSRRIDASLFHESMRKETEQLMRLSRRWTGLLAGDKSGGRP
ncbi:MAG: dihydrodipicolinate synthase family protein [Spirochaetota bacterium]